MVDSGISVQKQNLDTPLSQFLMFGSLRPYGRQYSLLRETHSLAMSLHRLRRLSQQHNKPQPTANRKQRALWARQVI
jgi:hypothetical protein